MRHAWERHTRYIKARAECALTSSLPTGDGCTTKRQLVRRASCNHEECKMKYSVDDDTTLLGLLHATISRDPTPHLPPSLDLSRLPSPPTCVPQHPHPGGIASKLTWKLCVCSIPNLPRLLSSSASSLLRLAWSATVIESSSSLSESDVIWKDPICSRPPGFDARASRDLLRARFSASSGSWWTVVMVSPSSLDRAIQKSAEL